jgi:hypothetical protein
VRELRPGGYRHAVSPGQRDSPALRNLGGGIGAAGATSWPGVFGLTVDGLGTVAVQVPEDRAEEAEALVSEEPEDEPAAESDADADQSN